MPSRTLITLCLLRAHEALVNIPARNHPRTEQHATMSHSAWAGHET
eukprot:COSAG06_NODE_45612_length_353_cov_1.000000_1_plen_45_part_10